jgi:hypothetical protein
MPLSIYVNGPGLLRQHRHQIGSGISPILGIARQVPPVTPHDKSIQGVSMRCSRRSSEAFWKLR